jgi:hypothetical protein
MALGESLIQNFLLQTLSVYFDNIDKENVSVAVIKGDVTLTNVHLRKSVLKQIGLGEESLRLVHGTAGLLKARVPWHRFGTAPIVFELEDLFVLVESASGGADGSSDISSSEEMERLAESAAEILRQQNQQEELLRADEGKLSSSSGWSSWFKSAGRIAKRIVDNIEETTVSTSIITKQTIIKNEDYFHSPLSPLQNMQKIEFFSE